MIKIIFSPPIFKYTSSFFTYVSCKHMTLIMCVVSYVRVCCGTQFFQTHELILPCLCPEGFDRASDVKMHDHFSVRIYRLTFQNWIGTHLTYLFGHAYCHLHGQHVIPSGCQKSKRCKCLSAVYLRKHK